MFLSKNKKDFRAGKKLIGQRRWREALTLLQPLQSASDIDQVELLSLLNQASDGILAQQITLVFDHISF